MLIKAVCVSVLAMLCASAAAAQIGEPLVGTWRLNVARSKYTGPPPKEFTIVVTPIDNGALSFQVDGIMADGGKVSVHYTATVDGKETPLAGDPRYTSVSVRKVDDVTYDTVFFKDGKEARVDRSVLSEGGRVRTLTARAEGMAVANLAVYEKAQK
jgi:hypothetical protein